MKTAIAAEKKRIADETAEAKRAEELKAALAQLREFDQEYLLSCVRRIRSRKICYYRFKSKAERESNWVQYWWRLTNSI